MFLDRKTSPTGSTPTASPNNPAGPLPTGHPPAVAPLHGASVDFGAMSPSLMDAVDTAVVGPRPEPYALMERVFDGLGAVKDVLDHLPPVGSVGEAEFAQGLCSAFQGLDLGRVIGQLHRLVSLRGDVDREGLRKLEKALGELKQVVDNLQAAPAGPGALRETIAELEGQLSCALTSLETAMTANLADAWMATSRSGIEVPASETLPMAVHHGMESMQTILDKALEVKDHQGGFEAFIRLRRDLQEFDLFKLGQHLADNGLDVRAEILDLLTLVATTGNGWDDRLDMTWVADRWDPIEAAIGQLATALRTASAQPSEAVAVVIPPDLPDDADGAMIADLLLQLASGSDDYDSLRLQRIANLFLEPGSCAELGRKLGDKAYSIGKWASELARVLATESGREKFHLLTVLQLEVVEIGLLSWHEVYGDGASASYVHWYEDRCPERFETKAVAQMLGDTLRVVKKKGALGEANIRKAVTYFENMLSGVDLRAVIARPDLSEFHLIHHLVKLEGSVELLREVYLTFGPGHNDIASPMQNAIRMVLRALMHAGIIPEEVLPAFCDDDWPSVPGIAFDPYPALPQTAADVMALVVNAVELGDLDRKIPDPIAQAVGLPDDPVPEGWAPALENLQVAVILARQSLRPLEHEQALRLTIEQLIDVLKQT